MAFTIKADLSSATYKATADINHYNETTQQRIRSAIADGVRATHAAAVTKAPYGATGNLKAGIETELHGSYGVVKSTAPHSHIVEFGTAERIVAPRTKKAMTINGSFVRGDIYNGKMPAKPFMRPAIEQERPNIEAKIEEAVKGESN